MEDVYFPTVAGLRAWFEANHDKHAEAWFGFYKVGTGVPSITYKDAVDECLCFGWIDGVRYKVDDLRWRERFTPRRAGSFWSSVNTKRAFELIEQGRMTPAGLAVFEQRDQSRTQRFDAERRRRRVQSRRRGPLPRQRRRMALVRGRAALLPQARHRLRSHRQAPRDAPETPRNADRRQRRRTAHPPAHAAGKARGLDGPSVPVSTSRTVEVRRTLQVETRSFA